MFVVDVVAGFVVEPAARRLHQLLAERLSTNSDRGLFLVSARQCTQAAFANYADFDPAVRNELVNCPLADYEQETGRLLDELAARRPVPRPRSLENPQPREAALDNARLDNARVEKTPRTGFLRRLFRR